MKQLIITLIITFHFTILSAVYTLYHDVYNNVNNTYTNPIAAVTVDIVSDFGRRDYSGSEWHKGVDLIKKPFPEKRNGF